MTSPIRAGPTLFLVRFRCIAQRKTNGRFICAESGSVKAAVLLDRKVPITTA
jgi:hypothetical protein